jgi:hypothetical protein
MGTYGTCQFFLNSLLDIIKILLNTVIDGYYDEQEVLSESIQI